MIEVTQDKCPICHTEGHCEHFVDFFPEEAKKYAKEHNLHISNWEFGLFLGCPFKHHLIKVLKYQEPTNEFLIFGSAVHNSIEEIIKTSPNKIHYQRIFNTKLKEQSTETFATSYFGKGMATQGRGLLNALDFHNRYKDYEVMGVEEELYEPLTTVNIEGVNRMIYFKGVIDCRLRHKVTGRTLLIDWKTAVRPWNLEKKVGKISFKTLYEKIKNDKVLTTEEIAELQLKIYFGQLALYKVFVSQKFQIPLDEIDTRYVALVRDPICIKQYDVDLSSDFLNYIPLQVQKAALEIIAGKSLGTVCLGKARHQVGMLANCQYCDFKNKECDNTKSQVVFFNSKVDNIKKNK